MNPFSVLLALGGLSLSACSTIKMNLASPIHSKLTNHITQSASWLVGPGNVGELVPGERIPQSVYQREGRDFDQLWSNQVVHLNAMDVYAKGFKDQYGDTVVNFPNLDVRVSLDLDDIVTGVWVGNSVRTGKGIGVGSTKSSLVDAYGEVTTKRLPEGYQCVMSSAQLPGVLFYFRNDCLNIDDESTVVKVQVVGNMS